MIRKVTIIFTILTILSVGQVFSKSTRKIIVKGNKSTWTKIATIRGGRLIKVFATGKVNFGCLFNACIDDAMAGVNGNGAWSWIQGNLEPLKDTILKGIKNPGHFLSVLKNNKNPKNIINKVKNLFRVKGKPVNFNQGGLWVKITDKDGKVIDNVELYYYWGKFYNKYGKPCEEKVTVWAKAHDGGKNPESRSGYGDNTGFYVVWIDFEDMNIEY